jgi:ankyrin repeat protein
MEGIWGAARAGDLAEMQRLVGHDPGLLDARDIDARTPLMWASREGHVGVVRWLVDNGAGIDERCSWGCTALFFACNKGHASVVRMLVEKGADPTIAMEWDLTPLIIASKKGHLEVVRILLGLPGAKVTINQRCVYGQTALCFACSHGRRGVVTALLENGADPTIADNYGNSPKAIAEGRREIRKALQVSFGPPAMA